MRSGLQRSLFCVSFLVLLSWLGPAHSAAAQCLPGLCTGDLTAGQCGINDTVCTGSPNNYTPPSPCAGNGCNFVNNCRLPTVTGPTIDTFPQGGGKFTAQLRMDVRAPWNFSARISNPNGTLDMFWYNTPTVPEVCDTGFAVTICEYLNSDHTECYLEKKDLTCAGAPYNFGFFSFRAQTCGGEPPCNFPFPNVCGRWVDKENLAFSVTKAMLGCLVPPKDDCKDCGNCKDAGPGRAGAGGGGGKGSPGKSGPGATLQYAAGGAGHPGFPGTGVWNQTLGRYWSHDYAQRIFLDPVTNNDTHVWLITETATFREFSGKQADGLYATVSPSNEYRKLYRTATGWELRELDGLVYSFDNAGLWTGTADPNGNVKTASYSAGRLAGVTFPDGRSETFTYDAVTAKLATITEVGVAGASSRIWQYTWTGDDLIRISRPDGTKWEFFYTDASNPGYMTRMELVGTDGSRRVETAWEYDLRGNAVKLWRGDTSFAGANAVDKWSFSFDDPVRPVTTLVTDPLGKVSTYTIGRDTVSDNPRIAAISGDCPNCNLGPNVQLFYEDAANPLRATRMVDGRGTTTAYTYDTNGLMTSKTEALGTPLERTTTWQYSSSFPALVTRMEVPSTSGAGVRATVNVYDGAGNLEEQTITGVESGSAFSHTTVSTFNAAGVPVSVDPPGYGTQDVTSVTYDPARGDLLPLTRTDPIVGTTTFSYDPFNRVISMTDPNALLVEMTYDALDRELATTRRGATPAEDIVTTNLYNALGDLLRVTLPEGNVLEYGYDTAGRLVTRERKPDASTSGERTIYVLDRAGNRTREEAQRWNGSSWVTEAATDYVYSSRCHLDKVVHADGSVTEYAYDCENNVERVWDANHPSGNQANPASQVYTYDVLNRITAAAQPWSGAGGGSAVTAYAYDVQDHRNRVTDPNGTVTSRTFSDRDLLTQETSEVAGTTSFLYNEHGRMTSRTDARNVTVASTFDALDRVTFVDFPESSLDTTYTYDEPAVPFSKGHLTAILRDGQTISYAYDRFARILQDGALGYSYNKNGNLKTIAYPGAVTALYSYDFADRPMTLSLQDGAGPAQPVVTASSYKPYGPRASLTLGNGLTETRTFDARYFPLGISVPGRLEWAYTTDDMDNVTRIDDVLAPTASRTFAYQDFHYFLTQGDGPWGTRSWSYDKTGNRLTETRDGLTDAYSYAPSAAGGNSPRLTSIARSGGSTWGFFHDAAGDLIFQSRDTNKLRYDYNAEQRLSQLRIDSDTAAQGLSRLTYDGRSFLTRATFTAFAGSALPEWETVSTYGSEGDLLHRSLLHRRTPSSPRNQPQVQDDGYVLYFGDRPAAIYTKRLSTPAPGSPTLTTKLVWLTSDLLGTPVLATDATGVTIWQGGFEPYGEDWNGAQANGIFLRFPGQWQDETWQNVSLDSDLYYNMFRWYDDGTGRYNRPDPLGVDASLDLYGYADQNPMAMIDRLGLLCTPNSAYRHCLARMFGSDPGPVQVHDNTGFFGWTFTAGYDVFYPGSCRSFWLARGGGKPGRPGEPGGHMLHEYFHAIAQWNAPWGRRMTLGSYIRESGRQILRRRRPHDDNAYEQEAEDFARLFLPKFKKCLKCTPGGDQIPPEAPPRVQHCGKCKPPFPW